MTDHLAHRRLVAGCLAAVLSAGLCSAGVRIDRQPVASVPDPVLAQLSNSLQNLARSVSPAVVQINVTTVGAREGDGRRASASLVRQHAVGAGVVVDPDGYIMTNAHVVAGAQRIRVAFPPTGRNGTNVPAPGWSRTLDATLVGLQRETDLALLKVDAHGLPTVRFCLDRIPQPGEIVFAIGSPEGLQNSVTMGVVSSAWRQPDLDDPMGYLQTDAPINPGNSGGPLVDVTGTVVGLNTFILSNGGGSEGLGFAIPAPVVDFVYHSLRKYGRVHHVDIGAVAQTITPALAQGLELPQDWGVIIADVVPSEPSDAVGLRIGDIIVAVDGEPIWNMTSLTVALYRHLFEQVLRIDVLRGTEKLSLEVPAVLARDPMDELANAADPLKSRIGRLGVLALDLDDRLRPLLPGGRARRGVVIIGQAAGLDSVDAGLQTGDVILSLNRTPVLSVGQLTTVVERIESGSAVALLIERRGQLQFLSFDMD